MPHRPKMNSKLMPKRLRPKKQIKQQMPHQLKMNSKVMTKHLRPRNLSPTNLPKVDHWKKTLDVAPITGRTICAPGLSSKGGN